MNKLLSCHYNMDTNRVEARFARGVSDFDIEHRTIRFLEYQASISHLNLKEY